MVKIFKCAERSRSSMMDVEDDDNHMRLHPQKTKTRLNVKLDKVASSQKMYFKASCRSRISVAVLVILPKPAPPWPSPPRRTDNRSGQTRRARERKPTAPQMR